MTVSGSGGGEGRGSQRCGSCPHHRRDDESSRPRRQGERRWATRLGNEAGHRGKTVVRLSCLKHEGNHAECLVSLETITLQDSSLSCPRGEAERILGSPKPDVQAAPSYGPTLGVSVTGNTTYEPPTLAVCISCDSSSEWLQVVNARLTDAVEFVMVAGNTQIWREQEIP